MSSAARLADLILSSGARRVAFLGLAKNVGKTTALLAALGALRGRGLAVGSVSAGRDGEAVDAITGEPKPRYRVRPGDLIASARSAFDGGGFALVQRLPFETRFGPIEVRRVEASGEVEMIGPSTAAQVGDTCAALERAGAGVVLVDGAFGRRAFASARVADAVVLSAGLAAGSDLVQAIGAARAAVELLTLGAAAAGAVTVRFEGALTDEALNRAIAEGSDVPTAVRVARGVTVVVEDFASVFLSTDARRGLADAGVTLAARRPARLLAVTSNPTAPSRPPADPGRFAASLREISAGAPVLDVLANVFLR